MMTEQTLLDLARTVIWCAFALGVIFGALAQKTNFCTMGAISDLVNFGDGTRMRMWVLAIAVAILGTSLLAWHGLIDTGKSFYTQPKLLWLSHILGGTMFGFGMVLAGGCGSKTLVRLGGGSLKALVVFIVLGFAAYMTLRGIMGVFRVNVLDTVAITLSTNQDLPSLFGDRKSTVLWVGGVIGLVLAAICVAKKDFWKLDHLLGGIGIGMVVVAAWYVSGRLGYVAEDPNTLQEAFVATNSGRMESFSFVAPLAYTLELLMFWSDKSKVVTVGIAGVLGVVVGSAAVALVTRTFRWEGFGSVEDTANHLVGAAFMGIGGVLALGCTIGQALSGISTLAVGSIISTLAIMAGGYAGIKYQAWRVEQMV